MPNGIIVCGANGSGKSTLGKELARALNYRYMDIEDYYFSESEIPYSVSRSREEAFGLILADINKYHDFVISAVDGDLGETINSMYSCAVYISAPLEVRLQRVKQRAYDRFGDRVLPGGDMYAQENDFYNFVASRSEADIELKIQKLTCPIIRVDGTKDISDNVELIVEEYMKNRN